MKPSKSKTAALSKLAFSLLLTTQAGFMYSAEARVSNYGVMIAPLETKVTKVIDPSSKSVSYKYTVDEIDIELTKKDLILAKNWNLSPSDWAQYKYIMEYTPRGTWTPNIDPPVALSVLAKSESEKMKYTKIANDLERDRQLRELGSVVMSSQDAEAKAGFSFTSVGNKKTKIEKQLGSGMVGAVNLFLSPDVCTNQKTESDKNTCNLFIMLSVSSTPSSYALTIYHKDGSSKDILKVLSDSGVTLQDVQRKSIEIKKSPRMFDKYHDENTLLPFWISQTDSKTKTKSAF